jgi:hypothetical protein
VPDYGPPLKVARELANYAEMLDFDQLIHEFGGWVAYRSAAAKRR